eukprot:1323427-Prymnesium_polylepis.1
MAFPLCGPHWRPALDIHVGVVERLDGSAGHGCRRGGGPVGWPLVAEWAHTPGRMPRATDARVFIGGMDHAGGRVRAAEWSRRSLSRSCPEVCRRTRKVARYVCLAGVDNSRHLYC